MPDTTIEFNHLTFGFCCFHFRASFLSEKRDHHLEIPSLERLQYFALFFINLHTFLFLINFGLLSLPKTSEVLLFSGQSRNTAFFKGNAHMQFSMAFEKLLFMKQQHITETLVVYFNN